MNRCYSKDRLFQDKVIPVQHREAVRFQQSIIKDDENPNSQFQDVLYGAPRKKGHKLHDDLHSQNAPESDRLNKGIPDNRVCYLQSAILPAYLIPHMSDLTARNPDRNVHD